MMRRGFTSLLRDNVSTWSKKVFKYKLKIYLRISFTTTTIFIFKTDILALHINIIREPVLFIHISVSVAESYQKQKISQVSRTFSRPQTNLQHISPHHHWK